MGEISAGFDRILNQLIEGELAIGMNNEHRETALSKIYANKITLAPGLGLDIRGAEPRIYAGRC